MATVLYTRKFLVLLSTFGLFYTLHPAVGVRFRFSDVPGYNPPAYNPPAYTGGSDAYLPSAPEKSSLVNEAPRKKRKGWKTAAKVAGGLGGAAALGGVGYGLYRMLRQKTPGQVTPDNGMPRPVLPLIPPNNLVPSPPLPPTLIRTLPPPDQGKGISPIAIGAAGAAVVVIAVVGFMVCRRRQKKAQHANQEY